MRDNVAGMATIIEHGSLKINTELSVVAIYFTFISISFNKSEHLQHRATCLGSAVRLNTQPTSTSNEYADLLFPGVCGSGPYEVAPACINCGHGQCGGCHVEDTYDDHSSYLCSSRLNADTTYRFAFDPPATPGLKSVSIVDTIDALGLGPAFSLNDHIRGQPRRRGGAPVDGEIEYRWTCCKCRSDNSCELNDGCSYCGDHWRQSCCTVYAYER